MTAVNMNPLFLILSLLFFSCGNTFNKKAEPEFKNISEPRNDTCDSPDADIACNFRNAPDSPGNVMNITSENEPGQKIRIEGQILKEDGVTPYPEILIYAYQTDSAGIYSKSGNETGAQKWQGRLHGWCMTDREGKYILNTVRPGKYPSGDIPAHIHWAVREPNGKMQYLNDFVFSDDKDVNGEYISKLYYIGDNGILTLDEIENGVSTAVRITVLK